MPGIYRRVFTSKHRNMPVCTGLLGELIIISLEMFLSYARRALMTTNPKKAHYAN